MKPFENYQLEELMQARAGLAQNYGQKVACSIEPQEAIVLSAKEAHATFYGLTHDTDSVCAVVRIDDEPFLRLVHYSTVVLLRRTKRAVETIDDRDPHAMMEFTESPAGERAKEKWAERYEELDGAPESDEDR